MSNGEEFEQLEAFHEGGTIAEFLDWIDTHPDWLDPIYGNYLIRRDTVRKAAFAVMRRSVEDGG